MHRVTSFIIAESSKTRKGKELPPTPLAKSAPHYFEKIVPSQYILGSEKIDIKDHKIDLVAKSYHPNAILVEANLELKDIFTTSNILELKEQLQKACYIFAKKMGAKDAPSEEYTIYQISNYSGDPEVYIEKYKDTITKLLKSEKSSLDEKEVNYSLSSQFKYSKDDLILVDWDGAFVFDPRGDFEENIEMLELANYQLLKYRIFDEDLDERMQKILRATQGDIKMWKLVPNKEMTNEFKEMIKLRVESIAQFEALERNIRLVGDWYSARLYELISKKFRLDGWRNIIKEKMESLEDIYTIASENLGMSRIQRLELVQIWAFFFLQIGWLVIIILELWFYTK